MAMPKRRDVVTSQTPVVSMTTRLIRLMQWIVTVINKINYILQDIFFIFLLIAVLR